MRHQEPPEELLGVNDLPSGSTQPINSQLNLPPQVGSPGSIMFPLSTMEADNLPSSTGLFQTTSSLLMPGSVQPTDSLTKSSLSVIPEASNFPTTIPELDSQLFASALSQTHHRLFHCTHRMPRGQALL